MTGAQGPAHARKALPVIDPAACTGCGRCVAICPPHVLWLEAADPRGFGPKHAHLHSVDGCTGCALCVTHCPFDAIHMARRMPPGASTDSESDPA